MPTQCISNIPDPVNHDILKGDDLPLTYQIKFPDPTEQLSSYIFNISIDDTDQTNLCSILVVSDTLSLAVPKTILLNEHQYRITASRNGTKTTWIWGIITVNEGQK